MKNNTTLILGLALTILASCTQYRAGTMVVSPTAPVVTGSAAAQVYTPDATECTTTRVLPASATVSEDAPALRTSGQVLYIGGNVGQDKQFEVDADASDTIAPATDLSLPGATVTD